MAHGGGPPDHVWALDYQHDLTVDGRALRFCNVIDESPVRHWRHGHVAH
ncbi:hypothetical protein U8D42_27650 (plasmid) [Mycobacterium europaeum]|nr:hypothetical protein [Mycobacterium europaeum]MEA1161356.1 hypothetical protein [Mycobacterium europaeum]